MWHFISEHISEQTQNDFVVQSFHRVAGGDTHDCYIVKDDTHRYFVKTSTALTIDAFSREAEGLSAIRGTNTLACPRVICTGEVTTNEVPVAYLVLQHIKFQSGSFDQWSTLGEQLATMHQSTTAIEQFGWPHPNYLGATLQQNTQTESWAHFFAEHRIGAMLEKLARKDVRIINPDHFVERVLIFLSDHKPTPSLVHGDLWSGNVGFCKHGPVVFDPAVYVGDAETDIAMTELFGRFKINFYNAYYQRLPTQPGYEARKQIYQLYHLLNHALLFGGDYVSSSQSIIQQFLHQY
ncbi:fructosamine kinase family protein [Alteromonas sp. ASW11-130]|uniref:fructosamine kinase family protein n=1 Tax=Alteromonas sp. ASW11-130 TaxID=3015775 RepID=UPI002242C002|nr:fructosamine kinase family protein [Alteromonas sp. ASW11-130]MCW8090630.1 fructosamine kinase family protein [Alteromonas sp. ASW11-130]